MEMVESMKDTRQWNRWNDAIFVFSRDAIHYYHTYESVTNKYSFLYKNFYDDEKIEAFSSREING